MSESVKVSSFKGKSGPARNHIRPIFYACPGHSNFDDDSIKNERASMATAFSHYKSMGNL